MAQLPTIGKTNWGSGLSEFLRMVQDENGGIYSFADETARDAYFDSSTTFKTPSQGKTCIITGDKKVQKYNGSAWADILTGQDLSGYQVTSEKGAVSGYASLDGTGKVPSSQLPSYVDDVEEYADLASFPGSGETGKIYVALDSNLIYRWSGSAYVELTDTSAVWGNISGTLANQTDLNSALNAKVSTTGDESVAGVKTFTSFPVSPSSAPSTDYQLANKKYVDDNLVSVAGADTQVQFNDGGSFGASSSFVWDKTSGLLGVGQATPTARIHSKGTTSDSTAYALKVDDSTDAKNFYVRNDGQVEFKNYTLPIADGTADQILKTNGSGALTWQDESTSTILSDADNDTKIQVEESADEDKIRFDTAGTERVVIDENGKTTFTGNVELPNTTNADQSGIVYKGTTPFIHNFNYGDNGTVTTIGRNTFVGEGSGNLTMGSTATSSTNSSFNTALGYQSFKQNVTGAANVAIGQVALYSNTTGNYNCTMGAQSLYSNTTGSYNCTMGHQSLFSNTTGVHNCAIGYNAGRYITGGSIANQTSDNSVYLGSNTKASADGNTYEIVIGYNVTGNGSNTIKLGDTNYNHTYLFGQVHTENYAFPTADGSADQVLKTDGSGTLTWQDDSTGTSVFESVSTDTVIREATNTNQYDRDFVIGSPQLDNDGDSAHYSRMFFDKGKGAFRAGDAFASSVWDNANLGPSSVAFGSGCEASGTCSHAVGYTTEASGEYSHAEGYQTTASGEDAHAEGAVTLASGDNSHAQGSGTTASGDNSHAEGNQSVAYLQAQNAQASGRFSVNGDAQTSVLVVRKETTNATTDVLALDGTTGYGPVLPASRTWKFRIDVAARQTGGTAGTVGDSAAYEFSGLIKRDGSNNTVIVGSVVKNVLVEEQAGWDVNVVADDTNESLNIQVTGEADKTVHWVGRIELVEVG